MSVDALKAAEALTAEYAAKVGDITAVRGRLYFDQADPVTAVARFLRTHCVDGWHQFLGEQIGGMLAWPPDEIEDLTRKCSTQFVYAKDHFFDEIIWARGAGCDADRQIAIGRQPVFRYRHLLFVL